jgi:hypothetical protein
METSLPLDLINYTDIEATKIIELTDDTDETIKIIDTNINLEIISDDNDIDWNTTSLNINPDDNIINIIDDHLDFNTNLKSILTRGDNDDNADNDTNADTRLSLNIKQLELNDISFFPNNEHFIKFKLPFDNDDNIGNIGNSNDKDFNFFGSEFSFGDQDQDQQDEEQQDEEQENEENEENEDDDDDDDDDDDEEQDTLDNVKKLIENQFEVRKLMLKEIIKSYLKPFKDNDSFRVSFVLIIIQKIKKIVKILNMENEVNVIIAEFLLTKKIVEDMQIYNYKLLFKPFLENSSSQKNFLNFILKFINKNKQLLNIDNVNDIFQEIYSNKFVHSFTFLNWYHDLNNSSLQKKLGIDFGVSNAIFNYLEDIISNLNY